MGREEQVEEREVLDSILPDEITDSSATENRIRIALDIPDDGEEEPPVMFLGVRYPEDYPDKEPHLDLSAPPNATAHPLFSVAEDKEQLVAGLQDTIQDNLGMAMIFTLVSTLKEEAEQLVARRKAVAAKATEEVARAAEREENKKFHGTPVNPETFLKWRGEFLREMEAAREREEEERLLELKKAKVKDPARLSGRQLWERGLATKADEEGVEDDDVPVKAVEHLKVDE